MVGDKPVYYIQRNNKTLKMYLDPNTQKGYFQVNFDEHTLYLGKSFDHALRVYEHLNEPRRIAHHVNA